MHNWKWYHLIELATSFLLKYRCWTFTKVTTASTYNEWRNEWMIFNITPQRQQATVWPVKQEDITKKKIKGCNYIIISSLILACHSKRLKFICNGILFWWPYVLSYQCNCTTKCFGMMLNLCYPSWVCLSVPIVVTCSVVLKRTKILESGMVVSSPDHLPEIWVQSTSYSIYIQVCQNAGTII